MFRLQANWIDQVRFVCLDVTNISAWVAVVMREVSLTITNLWNFSWTSRTSVTLNLT